MQLKWEYLFPSNSQTEDLQLTLEENTSDLFIISCIGLETQQANTNETYIEHKDNIKKQTKNMLCIIYLL